MPHWTRRILLEADGGAGGGSDAAPASTNDVTFAGKFKSAEALEQGFVELRGSMELDKIEVLVGDKGAFTNHQQLERAYLDLEKARSKSKPADPPKPGSGDQAASGELDLSGGTSGDGAGDDGDIDVPTLMERAGLELSALETQFSQKGKLTDEQYAAIRKAHPSFANVKDNVFRAMVDQSARGMILEGQQVAQAQQALHSSIAKSLDVEPAKLRETIAEMGKSVPDDKKAAIQRALNDPEMAELAVEKLTQYHRDAVGAGNSRPILPGDNRPGRPAGIRTVKDLKERLGDKNRRPGQIKQEDILNQGRFD